MTQEARVRTPYRRRPNGNFNASDFPEVTIIKVANVVSRIGGHVTGTALAYCSVAMAGIAEERLGYRAADDHAGHAGQETARHHAAHSHAASPHATESTLHRAGPANFGTRGQAGQRLRIILHRDSSSAALRIRHVG
jgi:hypothetical protein